jgi:hypothetical protein
MARRKPKNFGGRGVRAWLAVALAVGALAVGAARLASQEVAADAPPAVRANLPKTRLLSAVEAQSAIAQRVAALRQRQTETLQAQARMLALEAKANVPDYRVPQPPPDAPVPPRPDALNGEITRQRLEAVR